MKAKTTTATKARKKKTNKKDSAENRSKFLLKSMSSMF